MAYGIWLNQKGRPLADSYVCRVSDEEHWVFGLRSAGPAIRERLEAYLIADDVQLEDVSEAWTAFAVTGASAADSLRELGIEVPRRGQFVMAEGAFVFPARIAAVDDFAIVCRRDAAVRWREKFATASLRETTFPALERARIEAGVPAVPGDVGLNDLPNEAGLDEVAVSFTKGCFLGQEVMARLKNLGQVRRQLFRIRGNGAPPSASTPILQGNRKIGDVRTTAATGDGFVAMAMISLHNFKPAEVARLDDGRELTVEKLANG